MPVETPLFPIVSDVDVRLGRIPQFDDKSLNFPMRELNAKTAPIHSKAWKIRQRINQRTTPRCVGYGLAMEIGMQPYYHNITDFLADTIYQEAQKIDYWKHMPHDGTSTLAGLEIVRKLGIIPEYRWALKPSPMDDVLRTMTNIGPVVAGFSFYEGMYRPDASGVVSITGKNVGGHFMTFNELDWQKKRIYTANTWGDAGLWLKLDDFEKLIYDNGEVAVIVKRD
jgi:hypothetical protein